LKHSPLYTILFAAALGVACAGLLTVVRELTANRSEANRLAERTRHILDVLGIDRSGAETSDEILALYREHVRPDRPENPTSYARLEPDGKVKAVAYPFSGTGLWGPIKGYVALDPDSRTILSVTFYEQTETPGLGGNIVTHEFRSQFEGMRIPIRNGRAELPIHAISGATMTSRRVEAMLDQAVGRILKEGHRP